MRQPSVACVEHLRLTFGETAEASAVVTDLSFDVAAGETLCIVGESGAGKSLAALSLMRLEGFEGARVASGRLTLNTGQTEAIDLTEANASLLQDVRGAKIGMVFQEPMSALNPVLTIGQQIGEGLRRHLGLSRRAARARAVSLLQEVGLPEPEKRLAQYPHQLSGGMRQRVVIAMAVACRPRVLIADEPTTALDVTAQAGILNLIDRLKRETGMAVVFITHDMAVVAQIADRVIVMKAGRKVEEGPVEQIFAAPAAPYTKALLAAVPRLNRVRHAKSDAQTDAPSRLEVEGLCLRYPMRNGFWPRVTAQSHAVEDVSFTIPAGQTLALVGESGSGKSSVARAVLRLVEPQAGQVRLDGHPITGLPPNALRHARRQMQMVFQDPYSSLTPRRTVGRQVAEPLWNFEHLPQAEVEAQVADLFDRVGLPRSYMNRHPHQLSGGQRQRVAIARALILRPKLIVADEALSALDVGVQAEILDLMQDLQAEMGLSYLFVSHDIAVVEQISHRIAVMYRGRIVEQGPCLAVLSAPAHPYTKRLLASVPVPDPTCRNLHDTLCEPIPVPVHPPGHPVERSVYSEVSSGHLVLASPDWHEREDLPDAPAMLKEKS